MNTRADEWDWFRKIVRGRESTGIAMPCLLLAIHDSRKRWQAFLGHFFEPLNGCGWNPTIATMLEEARSAFGNHFTLHARGLGYRNASQGPVQRECRRRIEELLDGVCGEEKNDCVWLEKGAAVIMEFTARGGRGRIMTLPPETCDLLKRTTSIVTLSDILSMDAETLDSFLVSGEGF